MDTFQIHLKKICMMRKKVLIEIWDITKMPVEGKEVWKLTATMNCMPEVKSTCA